MTTKKFWAGLFFALLPTLIYAQNGLENILVEKYYVSNVADSIQADVEAIEAGYPTGALPTGSVTYRFYADMLPGYKLISVYADAVKNHPFKLTTSGSFYNHPNGNYTLPLGTSKTSIKNNLNALDTYLTLGAVAKNNYGIFKSEDNGAINNITVAANPTEVLLNKDATIGIPLTMQDGMIAGTGIVSPSFIGFTDQILDVISDGSVIGNTMELLDGAMFSNNGASGPIDSTNKVLIAQITVNGDLLSYEFNLLLKSPNGATEYYVPRNPVQGEILNQSLMGIAHPKGMNLPPIVSISSPSDIAVYYADEPISINVDAYDRDGYVKRVEFFINDVSIGIDSIAPFTGTYRAPFENAFHRLFIKATDDLGLVTVSDTVHITVATRYPSVVVMSPQNGASYRTGDTVQITTFSTRVTSVDFLIDNISIGIDTLAPFTASYIAVKGTHSITLKYSGNDGSEATQYGSGFFVDTSTVLPFIQINVSYLSNKVNVSAFAEDPNGVAFVDFFSDNNLIGRDSTFPYAIDYQHATGNHAITARLTNRYGVEFTSGIYYINIPTIQSVYLDLEEARKGVGYIDIPVSFDYLRDVISLDFAIKFNNQRLIYQSIVDAAPYLRDVTANYSVDDKTLYFTSNSPQNYIKNTTIVYIRFTTITGIVDSSDFYDLRAYLNGNAIRMETRGDIPDKYKLETITGNCTEGVFCLPIVATDTVKSVIGYDLVLKYDQTKVHPTGSITLKNALINAGYASYVVNNDTVNGLLNIAIFLNSAAPAGTTFNGIGELGCIEFAKYYTLFPTDTARFTVTSLQESYVNGVSFELTGAGNYINRKSTFQKGILNFWTNNSPIKYDVANPGNYLITSIYGADLNCTSKSAVAVQPDLNGNFSYNTINGGSMQIERDILPLTNVQPVINGYDASLGYKVLVNDLSFIPSVYQAIALDVNQDGAISAGDVSQINQRSVRTISEFRQKWNYNNSGTSNGQLSKDWLFIDSTLLVSAAFKKSLTYPFDDGSGYSKFKVPVAPFCLQIPATDPHTCSNDRYSYTGILLGDVDGNYDAIPANGELKRVESPGTIYVNLDKALSGPGYIDIPVSFESSEKIVALDFALKFNEDVLNPPIIKENADYLRDALANHSADDKTWRFTSNSSQNYDADKNVVVLRFNTRSQYVKKTDFYEWTGYLNGRHVKMELKENLTTSVSIISGNTIQIYPNPANEHIYILAPENMIVELLDLQGRKVVEPVQVIANEKLEVATHHLAKGTYLLKMHNEHFISAQRLVINNE